MANEIALTNTQMHQVGQVANAHATNAVFTKFTATKAANTVRRYQDDLGTFVQYLADVTITTDVESLMTSPKAWAGMTWGIVEGYKAWLLRKGFAIRTVNVKLSVVKAFADLAMKAGAIAGDEASKIKGIGGFAGREAKNVDSKRTQKRMSTKKEQFNVVNTDVVKQLLGRDLDSPQGRRDAVMIGLMAYFGLRVGELVDLKVSDVDMINGVLKVYRPKVDKHQVYTLKNGLLKAMTAYYACDCDMSNKDLPLLRASRKGGKLDKAGLNRFAIAKRIAMLGQELGIKNLSPHDFRHTGATEVAKAGDVAKLMNWGGWTNPTTAIAYVERGRVANEGVELPY